MLSTTVYFILKFKGIGQSYFKVLMNTFFGVMIGILIYGISYLFDVSSFYTIITLVALAIHYILITQKTKK